METHSIPTIRTQEIPRVHTSTLVLINRIVKQRIALRLKIIL